MEILLCKFWFSDIYMGKSEKEKRVLQRDEKRKTHGNVINPHVEILVKESENSTG